MQVRQSSVLRAGSATAHTRKARRRLQAPSPGRLHVKWEIARGNRLRDGASREIYFDRRIAQIIGDVRRFALGRDGNLRGKHMAPCSQEVRWPFARSVFRSVEVENVDRRRPPRPRRVRSFAWVTWVACCRHAHEERGRGILIDARDLHRPDVHDARATKVPDRMAYRPSGESAIPSAPVPTE